MERPSTTERRCTRCRETRPLREFYHNATMPLGRTYTCKDCDKLLRTAAAMRSRGAKALRAEIDRDDKLLTLKRKVLHRLEAEYDKPS